MAPAAKYLIQITSFTCFNEDGTNLQNCQNLVPAVSGNNCNNLVKSLKYIFRYDYSNNVGGIVEAGIEATFFTQNNYLTSKSNVLQDFSVFFIPSNIKLSDFNLLESQKLSGNPGYLVKKPVKAGVLVNSAIR